MPFESRWQVEPVQEMILPAKNLKVSSETGKSQSKFNWKQGSLTSIQTSFFGKTIARQGIFLEYILINNRF